MPAEKAGIKIGELVSRTGVTRATIHHYVREGLLPKPVKTSRNMALYDPDCVERILLVKGLQRHQRRSLAEVKTMLERAPGHEGISRLRQVLADEAARTKSSPLAVDGDKGGPVPLERLVARSGFARKELLEMHTNGVISVDTRNGEEVCDTLDADVVDVLSRLRKAGFDREGGFKVKDVTIYVHALRELMMQELGLFLENIRPDEEPEAMFARAEQGLNLVTPLLLALRRKLLRELLDAASLPERHD